MTEDQRLDLIKQEYFKIQDFYEDFDKRAQNVKGWSITIGLAAIAAGVNYKNEYAGLFSAICSLVFWTLETIIKVFQYHYRARIQLIEEKMRLNSIVDLVPLQIYTSWFESYKKSRYKFNKVAALTIVYLPHLPIFILGLSFFICQHYKIMPIW